MTPQKKAASFFMSEQEMLSPIKKGIKLDVSKLNISNFNDPSKREKKNIYNDNNMDYETKQKNKKDPHIEMNESEKIIKKKKSTKQPAHTILDKSSSTASSKESVASSSFSACNSSDSDLGKRKKKSQPEGRQKEQKEKRKEINEKNNKRKLQKKTSDDSSETYKKPKTQNSFYETSKNTNKKKNLIEDDSDDDDDDEKIEQNIESHKTGINKSKNTKNTQNKVQIETPKNNPERLNTKEPMRRMQTRSSKNNNSRDSKDIEIPESKKRKKQMEQDDKQTDKQKEFKKDVTSNNNGGVKEEKLENLNLKDCIVELVDENSCKYEDGIIFESILVNKTKYSINDNVLAYCPKENTNKYILKKGKISGIFQNFNSKKVEIEICFYYDSNDEVYIRELEQRQKLRRSKDDFVGFLDEKTKHFHLLGHIEFKIIEAHFIKQLIYVYNEKKEFEKDKEFKEGTEKFLCTYYLKEREDRICEIQNEDHWDNLVLGSSNIYYYFTNNRKNSKNKSLQLIIDKMKIHESISNSNRKKQGGTSDTVTPTENKDVFATTTPRKAQTTTNKASKAANKQQKSKTTTHKESAKERTDFKGIDIKRTDTKKVDAKKGTKKEKEGDITFDLQNAINEDKEQYYFNLLRSIKDPTDKAIRMMQLDVVPKYLPCREKEIKEVHNFLESGIRQAGSNQILYISGMPGTGKTATVYSVIHLLQMKSKKKLIPEFNVLEINGMNVVHPNAAYQVFYKQLFNKKPPNALNSYKIIDRLFNKTKKDNRNVSILIIDEIDYLITKTQKVLFTFFDWPTKVNSKLVLIAISNTMDLPERLIPRCRSRLAFGRLVFSPYKGDEIEKIIKERLENCKEVMDHTAIQLCARKVANVSGDIRKALQICRKAFENKRGQKVVPRDITEASNQLFDSPLSNAINYLPWAFKIFLTCIIIELRMLNEFIIPYKKVVNRYKTIIETSGRFVGMYSDTELFKIMLDKLVKMGILLIRPYIPLEDMSKKSKEAVLGFNESVKKNEGKGKTQLSPDIDKESGDMGLEVNVETQLIITALMKDAECSKKLNFFT